VKQGPSWSVAFFTLFRLCDSRAWRREARGRHLAGVRVGRSIEPWGCCPTGLMSAVVGDSRPSSFHTVSSSLFYSVPVQLLVDGWIPSVMDDGPLSTVEWQCSSASLAEWARGHPHLQTALKGSVSLPPRDWPIAKVTYGTVCVPFPLNKNIAHGKISASIYVARTPSLEYLYSFVFPSTRSILQQDGDGRCSACGGRSRFRGM
jgi:hypothetical protein